ncbi:MAG: SurA N-terminal domain-containing protein, partial [Alphaproteobacteria bacterium]|nr:SurA N-terminal domain-containing protein [Alphaproteobacteria bacterium]
MKKSVFIFAAFMLSAQYAVATDVDLQELDSASRMEKPSSNSIMFRKNAEMYQQLTDEQKEEINRQREEARKQMEEYERQKAEYEAMVKAQQEAERKRAEELKPITLYGNSLKIYALVNGEVISSSDMQSRINAFIMTTGIPYNAKTKSMIMNKVLQSAIDEKLKIQEAKKNKIQVTPQEIKSAVREFEKSNGMREGQLKNILSQGKVSMNVWVKQIEADLAWKKLISSKGYGRIGVGENEIKRAFDDIKKDMTTQKYMVSEIVI